MSFRYSSCFNLRKNVKVKKSSKICNSIKWNYYLNNNINVKIKVNSIASKAFHETGLKEIAHPIILPFIQGISTGEHSNEDTVINFELYKDKLTVSMSLVGQTSV